MSDVVSLSSRLDGKRALLANRLRNAVSRTARTPLSFAQQRLWFLDQLEPNSPLYNILTVARLLGNVNADALEQSLNIVLARHQALRTRFVSGDDGPEQMIDENARLELRRVDFSTPAVSDPQDAARQLIRKEVNRPFDLSQDLLMRVCLVRLTADEHLLVLVMHHIVSDEWSLKVLFRELGEAYSCLVQGQLPNLPVLPIQYPDYAIWQRQWLQGEVLNKQIEFWRRHLSGDLSVTQLPADRPRRLAPGFRGGHCARQLGAILTGKLSALALNENATLFMVLLAAFKALLFRYTRLSDIVVGSPIAGRNRLETENLIGFFVNTLPLRTTVSADLTFREFLRRVRETTLGAYANQDLPLERLVEELRPERTLGHMPFSMVMFALQSNVLNELHWQGLHVRFLEAEGDTSKFDLTLVLQETTQGLIARAEYNSDLFEAATIERLLEHYSLLLEGIVASPDLQISKLPLLSPAERESLLTAWNATATEYPKDKTIHRLFEEQAARSPDSIAIADGRKTLTYRELNTRANQLAHYLARFKVRADLPVGIFARSPVELVVGCLATLKAGGAYVPLDPSYPKERLAFMLADLQAPVVITQQALLSRVPRGSAEVVCLDADWELIARESRVNLQSDSSPESLAYIIYTSGSTGRPKGVAVPHRAVARLVLNTSYIRINVADRIAQVSNPSFDAVTFEIWGALLNGAQLVSVTRDVALSPADFARDLHEKQITTLFLTTALFNQLAAEAPGAFERVRTVMAGGEPLEPKWVRAVLQDRPPVRLLNAYGPTENTTFSTFHDIRQVPADALSVPIGKPISNTQAYVLDPDLNPVPIGIPGELYLGGDGLARGYWNRSELTAEKFVANPFCAGARLYRTGDLAKWLPDGTIEFLGRIDNQVKVRGFRIEPGEIETVLVRHPAVRECVVAAVGGSARTRRLVAYCVFENGPVPNASQLRQFLHDALPDYMVPSAFVTLQNLPLTANGKVDRRALPAPDQDRPALEREYRAPTDEVELRLARIWENVLNVRPIGIQDKFFDLGGHSLLAVKVIAQIEKAFGRKLRVATIFLAPTIQQLAAILREEIKESTVTHKSSIVEIQGHGTRPPLFLVHGAGGGMFWGYANLSKHLGCDQPVYGFKSRALDGREELATIEEIAAQYLADLRQVQPHGPYHLGGYCFGGIVAYEMARQLSESGETVGFVGLLNCAPPNSRYTRIPWTFRWGMRLMRNLVYWGNYCRRWSRTQRRDFIRWKWSVARRRVASLLSSGSDLYWQEVHSGELVDLSSFTEEERKTWRSHIHALVLYKPKPYAGRVHLLRSPGHPLWCSFDPDYGWGDLAAAGVSITIVPGAHEKILEEPCVGELACQLTKLLLHPGISAGDSSATNMSRAASEEPVARAILEGDTKPFPAESSYAAEFEKAMQSHPSRVAVRCHGQGLTYEELNRRANKLAHYLRARGVGQETLVAICMDRSFELAVGLLAVFKAGGAYLPLDPDYPKDRLAYMLEDSQARLLLTHQAVIQALPEGATHQVINLDDPQVLQDVSSLPEQNVTCVAGPDSLAYVIYTSGSTGSPKGVEITHRALLNHNYGVAAAYGLFATDCVLQFAPISFDISVEEVFPTWLVGGTVVFRTAEMVASPKSFLSEVDRERLTVLNLPTAFWHELVETLGTGQRLPPSIRLVVVGGEKVSREAFKRWQQFVDSAVVLMNGYGVTEATVSTTVYTARKEDLDLPIGRPLPNCQVIVVGDQLQPVSVGTEGELLIGGEGLARGYLNRPDLTARKFIANPFPEIRTARLYRTGDVVRLREDGNLEFVGRTDNQVKFSGYRIELGEIEAALREHPEIKDAAVLLREDKSGNKKLVGYFVPRECAALKVQQLTGFLKAKLPVYMVPGAFVTLDALPLTPAGKIDRHNLPEPGTGRPDLEEEYVVPRSPMEEQLARLWIEVLGVSPVGVRDNFFDLGGHSLSAIQLVSRIRDVLAVELTLEALFSSPTVEALAAHILRLASPLTALENSGLKVPISTSQQRLWFLDIFEPHLSPYNRSFGLRLEGQLQFESLQRALTALVRRHEALRAIFPAENGRPVQYIFDSREIILPVVDLTNLPEPSRREEAYRQAGLEAGRSHITTQPALRAVLFRISSQEHWLLIVLHELVADRRSVRLLIDELSALYTAIRGGVPDSLPSPTISYLELASQQISSQKLQQDFRYWQNRLQKAPALLDLPADRPRPDHRSDAGTRQDFQIPAALVRNLEALAKTEGADLFTSVLSAFATLLSRYTGATDLVIGTRVVPTDPKPLDRSIANHENVVALRCDIDKDTSFSALVNRLKRIVEEAREHATLPFADLIERLSVERNPSYTPVFQVMLVLNEAPFPSSSTACLKISPFDVDNGTVQVDIALHLTPAPDGGLAASLRYSTALFDHQRIARLVDHFSQLLENATENAEQPLRALNFIPEKELRTLTEWNDTSVPWPEQETIGSLFLSQVERTPNAEALVCGSSRFSYLELKLRAMEVAWDLNGRGIGPESLVGICMTRSENMVAAMLGTLLAGAAYVPLDPSYPRDRLSYILSDSKAAVLLTDRKCLSLFNHSVAEVVCVDDLYTRPNEKQGGIQNHAGPKNLAYVIYTSGSTGQPKGVALEHRNAVAFIAWAQSLYDETELDGVLAATSICFDLSVFEIFVPLCSGGRVILAENALALPALQAAPEVKLINTVPSAIRELLRVRGIPASVKVVNLAGEPLAASLVDEIYNETSAQKVYDLYGPTETTTYSTFALREAGKRATIGRPLANEQVYILDQESRLLPIGIPGELFIGGVGLARGYFGRPDLTAQRFVPHPFQEGARLYRTGDLARWREDGTLEYLGRLDHQVKIRGFRIELGEIESALKRIDGIRDAVAIAREDQPGLKRLVAYVAGRKRPFEFLRDELALQLPEYMLPSAIVQLEKLPLTPNGKIDRKALPAPEQDQHPRADFVAPRNTTEAQIAGIWREVLHLKQVGVFDNFFHLGGDSLLAIQVISRIRELLKVDLPLFSVFTAPTVAGLAEGLSRGLWTANEPPPSTLERVPRNGPLPTSFVQERLWFLHQLDPTSAAYNVPAALRLSGKLDDAALENALGLLIQRHEPLRSCFHYDADHLHQVILPDLELDLFRFEVPRNSTPDEKQRRISEWLSGLANQPFNLERGPLLRAGLARINDTEHVLAIVLHHTVADGWSLAVLFQEWAALYDQLVSGAAPVSLPALQVQYVDFAAWQRQWMSGSVLERELAYWRKTLAGAPPAIDLPTQSPDVSGVSNKVERKSLNLAAPVADGITKLGHARGTTPFVILLSALAATLAKWTGQSDLVIGTVVAGRQRRELESLIGCFMNFLPLRIRTRPDQTVKELLQTCRNAVLEGQEHQNCPFERIVEAVNPQRRLNGNPLYNVALLLQNFPAEVFTSRFVNGRRERVETDAPLLDLRFEAEQTPEGLRITCEYRSELFEASTVEHLLASYSDFVSAFARKEDARIGSLDLAKGLEARAQVQPADSQAQTIVISATFTAEPVADGLRFWMAKLGVPADLQFAPYNQVFQQLLDPTSMQGQNLRGFNVLLIRLEDWLKAPPLDGQAADASLRSPVRDFCAAVNSFASRSSIPLLVCVCPASPEATRLRGKALDECERELLEACSALSGVHVLSPAELLRMYPVAEWSDSRADQLGHVPYTPVFFTAVATAISRKFHALNRKAVKVIALDCDNTLWGGVCGEDGAQGIRLDEPYKSLQAFMKAQMDAGFLLCLCSKNNEEDVWDVFARRSDLLLSKQDFAATRLNWAPKSANLTALAQELNLGLDSFVFIDDNPVECAEVRANCPGVITLELPQDPAQIRPFLEHCWVFDHLKVTAEDRRRSLMYLQNRQREQLRAAAPGLKQFLDSLGLKIIIQPMAPDQVSRASQLTQRTNQFNATTLRLTELQLRNAQQEWEFLTVSVSDKFGDYGLTGLIMCRASDGKLLVEEFLLSCRVLGRGVEHRMLSELGQVALRRGLGWVDLHFTRTAKNKPVEDFLESLGKLFKQPQNGGFLYRFPAQVAAAATFEPPANEATATPDMAAPRPSNAVESGRLEISAHYGEIAGQLRDPVMIHQHVDSAPRGINGSKVDYVPAASHLEEQLVELWRKLLKVDRVGITDDFFELGGHSLLAVRLFADLEKVTGRKLPLVTLFQAPTIQQLAQVLTEQKASGTSLLVPIQPNGSKPPLFLVHGAGGDVLWGYANLAAHMSPDQPVYGIKSRGQVGLDECATVEEMAQCYLQAIRQFQPEGPYMLGGYCFGGNVAYEIARQLTAAGQEVAMVALLDSAPSNAGYERVTWWRPAYPLRFIKNFTEWLKDFAALKSSERRIFVLRKMRAVGRKIKRRLGSSQNNEVDLEEVIDPSHFPQHELKLWQAHLQAMTEHADKEYSGHVALLRTVGQPLFCSLEEDFCWGKLVQSGIKVIIIPGSHESIFVEPQVRTLAHELQRLLDQTQARVQGRPSEQILKEAA